MLQVLGQGGVLSLAVIGAMAWGFARVLDAPKWSGQAILLVLVLVALAGQLLLPPDAPFRQSVAGSIQFLVLAAILAVPVLGYRMLLRRVRAPVATPTHPTGFVLIEDDAALAKDMAAHLLSETEAAVAWDPSTFSIAHRANDGQIVAAGQVVLTMGLAEFRRVWVDPDHRGQGLGRRLVAEMEAEARRRGATRAALDTFSWQGEGFWHALGYAAHARLSYPEGGAERISLSKDL